MITFTPAEQAQIDDMVERIQSSEVCRDSFIRTTDMLAERYKAHMTEERQRELMARQIAETRTRTIQTSAPTYRKEIVYDRETRDYAMYLDGELAGFARTYHEAEITLDNLVFQLMSGQYFVRTGEKPPISPITPTEPPPPATMDMDEVVRLAIAMRHVPLPDEERYAHEQPRAQAPTLETECANCYSLQPCYDDGEAYICVDRVACGRRQAENKNPIYLPAELPIIRAAYRSAITDNCPITAESLVAHAMCEVERYVRGATEPDPGPPVDDGPEDTWGGFRQPVIAWSF